MTAIFINHSSADNAAAAEMKAWLEAQGHFAVPRFRPGGGDQRRQRLGADALSATAPVPGGDCAADAQLARLQMVFCGAGAGAGARQGDLPGRGAALRGGRGQPTPARETHGSAPANRLGRQPSMSPLASTARLPRSTRARRRPRRRRCAPPSSDASAAPRRPSSSPTRTPGPERRRPALLARMLAVGRCCLPPSAPWNVKVKTLGGLP